jgi:hypothetical protein
MTKCRSTQASANTRCRLGMVICRLQTQRYGNSPDRVVSILCVAGDVRQCKCIHCTSGPRCGCCPSVPGQPYSSYLIEAS